jgi:hypothetical protein
MPYRRPRGERTGEHLRSTPSLFRAAQQLGLPLPLCRRPHDPDGTLELQFIGNLGHTGSFRGGRSPRSFVHDVPVLLRLKPVRLCALEFHHVHGDKEHLNGQAPATLGA